MILVNGIAADGVAAGDRGLHYGDGVFRTLRLRGGRVLHWPPHLEKLQADCRALRIACPDNAALHADISAITRGLSDGVVKVMVTRGSGLRGYAPPAQTVPTRVVMGSPFSPAPVPPGGINVHLCALRLGHQPALAGIKHLNRLENVLARAEWNDASIHEGLLCDQEGNAIGGTMSNLFIVEDGALVTPDLTRCGVAGVTRQRVMKLARRNGLQCKVENILLQRVYNAGEWFLVNSVIGLWPAARLEQKVWTPGTIAAKVKHWLEEDDAAA